MMWQSPALPNGTRHKLNSPKLMTTTIKIKGGKKGFNEACDEAYSSRMHNPCVRYSPSNGFHAESAIHPADDDVIWEGRCDYWANNGKRTAGTYTEARKAIINALENE